jgi:hypothetical protein
VVACAGIEHCLRKPRARGANGAGASESANGNIPEDAERVHSGVSFIHEAHPEISNTAMEYEPLGWALMALGAAVFAITMYMTFRDTGRRS